MIHLLVIDISEMLSFCTFSKNLLRRFKIVISKMLKEQNEEQLNFSKIIEFSF